MRADLHRLIDAVARRTMRLEVDMALEQSARAVLHTDRVGDHAATFIRYAVSPADALQAVCLDGAAWANGQTHRTGGSIETAFALPQLELAAALAALADELDSRSDRTFGETVALGNAREALRRWGEL